MYACIHSKFLGEGVQEIMIHVYKVRSDCVACIYRLARVCFDIHVCICVYIYVYVYKYVYIYIYICVFTCMCIYVCMCMCM